MPALIRNTTHREMVFRRGQLSTFWSFRAVPAAVFLLAVWTHFSSAQAEASSQCDIAARRAADESKVPLSVLMTITRTETGRSRGGKLQPWPWTTNVEGKGQWFTTMQEAMADTMAQFESGVRSFDVGCFQINYRWHGQHFDSIQEMFDPLENARYAARFLQQLYDETGDWSAAAGAYHSRTPKYATRYRTRFDQIMAALDSSGPALPTIPENAQVTQVALRKNTYPLLRQVEAARSAGSLVTLSGGSGQAVIDFNVQNNGL